MANYRNLVTAICSIVIIALCKDTNTLPVTARATAEEVRLLSQQSGHFVRVSENGDINANANINSATVFLKYLKDSYVQLEVMDKHGVFLMLQIVNQSESSDAGTNETSLAPVNATESSGGHEYTLVVGTATDTGLTRWEKAGPANTLKSLDGHSDCYVAFESNGEVAGPCNLSSSDPKCVVTMIKI